MCNCGNYDESYKEDLTIQKTLRNSAQNYQPDLYYYWDSPIEEDYDWRDALPNADCLCEICFDILNSEKKLNGCANNISVTSKVDLSTSMIII